MYKVRDANQNEYGPADAQLLRSWVTQGRANAQTLVQVQGTTEWKPLASVSEFADLFSGAPQPPPLRAAASVSSPLTPAKTSGLATASLVLGLLGFCGITGIAGIVCGIMAHTRIRQSGGRLKGSGLATTGIALSAMFLLLLILAAVILPALAKAKVFGHPNPTTGCVNNLKQLALAVRIYANDHSDTYPTADTWCDLIQNDVASPKPFRCPANPGQTCGYAYNTKLSGLNESKINPQTVMLFESDAGWNGHGGPEAMTTSHDRTYVVGFADGSVRQLKAADLPQLRWDP